MSNRSSLVSIAATGPQPEHLVRAAGEQDRERAAERLIVLRGRER
jgi:hypothetical protein